MTAQQLAFPVRRTSLEAYEQIREDNSLSTARFRVYRILHKASEPMTGQEVNLAIGRPSGHKRLSELRDLRVIKEAGIRTCTVTGKRATTWATNGKLPDAAPRRQRVQKPSATIRRHASMVLEQYIDGGWLDHDKRDNMRAVAQWLRS